MSPYLHAHRQKATCVLSAAFFVIALGALTLIKAQCPPNTGRAWPKGTHVTFHIDPSMSAEEQAGIRSAIEKWNIENESNGSGVSFHEVFNPMQIPAALNFQNEENPATNPDGTTS
jgi:hypothetical protein